MPANTPMAMKCGKALLSRWILNFFNALNVNRIFANCGPYRPSANKGAMVASVK
jgi:hypothetical protein